MPFVTRVLHKTSCRYLQGSSCHKHICCIWWHFKHCHMHAPQIHIKKPSSYHWGIRIPLSGTPWLNTQRKSNPCRANKKLWHFTESSHELCIWEKWAALMGETALLAQYNHRIIGWKRSSSPTINSTLLNHIPKCHICMFFEHLQGRWLHHFPGQPVPEGPYNGYTMFNLL